MARVTGYTLLQTNPTRHQNPYYSTFSRSSLRLGRRSDEINRYARGLSGDMPRYVVIPATAEEIPFVERLRKAAKNPEWKTENIRDFFEMLPVFLVITAILNLVVAFTGSFIPWILLGGVALVMVIFLTITVVGSLFTSADFKRRYTDILPEGAEKNKDASIFTLTK